MTGRTRILSPLLVLALLAGQARAEDDVAEAARHFTDGIARFEAGDFEGARVAFGRADRAHHAPAAVYNIGRADEALGHPQAAVDAYERYIAEAGDRGEHSAACALAIAQIKARSARLRVETDPPGARAFVDGFPVEGTTPATLLVTIGRHHLVAEGDGWRGEEDVETTTPALVTVAIVRGARPPAASVAPPGPTVDAAPKGPPPARQPEDLVYGFHVAVVPYDFLARAKGDGRDARQTTVSTGGVGVGVTAEVGYALTEKAEILARGTGAFASEGNPFTSIWAAGAAFSYRVLPPLWLGAGFVGGRGHSDPDLGPSMRFDTDMVFAPTLEVSFAVIDRPSGQWLLSATPALLLAAGADNPLFYMPVGLGYRGF